MQIGFVGLGAMGSHMARNLAQAGLLRGVWNRTTEKATALAAELKCHAFVDLAELAANSEAVVICVSADEDVRSVVAGLEPALSPRKQYMGPAALGSVVAAGSQFVEAIRYGDDPERRAELRRVVEGALDTERLERMLHSNALSEEVMDTRRALTG